MIRIRRLNYFDIPKISKMIEYLDSDDGVRFKKDLSHETIALIQSCLPLKYRFLPESYVLINDKEIHGIITVVPTSGNPYKINITRLIFRNNS